MKTTQIISVYNSELISKPLSFPFEYIMPGDVLYFTNEVETKTTPDGHSAEYLIFEKSKGGTYVKLSLSKIIGSRGTVGESIRKAIKQGDLKTGKDLIDVLNSIDEIRVGNITAEDRYTHDGARYKLTIYTLNWC